MNVANATGQNPKTNAARSRGPLGISRNWWILMGVGIGIALFITFFSPWASSDPDGLNRVAEDTGFGHQAKDPGYEIIPGYSFPGVENERLARILSGIVGVLLVAVLALGFGYLTRRSRRASDATPPASASPGGSGV